MKEAIVKNTERDTILTNRTLRNTSRVARNAISRGGGARSSRTRPRPSTTCASWSPARAAGANVLEGGDIDGGIWSAGQSQGLIHDIPTCEELVKRINGQAEDIIHARLDRMAGTLVAAE